MPVVKIPAIKLVQSGIPLYLATLTAEQIAAGISKPDAWTPYNRDGYQRVPSETRVKKISKYLLGRRPGSKPILPQAVLLNARGGESRLNFVGNGVGYLELQDGTMLYEVDGQHRLAGIRYALESDPRLGSYPLPVVITEGLERLDEALLFFLVNTEQKRVSTDLAQRLIEQQMDDEGLKLQIIEKGQDWIPKATKIVDLLTDKDGTPWFGKIGIPGASSGRVPMKQVSFVSSLKPMLTSPLYGQMTPPEGAEILGRYWIAWEEICPEAFRTPDEYVIQKTAGVFPLHAIATDIFERVRTTYGSITSDGLVEVLRELDSNLGKDYDSGSALWHRKDGEAGKYAGAKGFRIIEDILREHLPPMKKARFV
jgi:DGQHR domain-containing protein